MTCKCGAKSCFFCSLMTVKEEMSGDTPLTVQKNAQLEDVCSICDCEYGDFKYFPKKQINLRDKYEWYRDSDGHYKVVPTEYTLDTVTLEIEHNGVKLDIHEIPVLAFHDLYRYTDRTETFFIGNGSILRAFGHVERGDMCGYPIMPFMASRVYILSEGVKDNIEDGYLVGPIHYPNRIYYIDVFND